MQPDELEFAVTANVPAGWHAHYFASVASTQDEARAAARNGAPGRSIFVADFQSAGRGRQGRSWQADPGVALLMSLLFREEPARPVPWRWTCLAAVALCEAIECDVPDAKPRIKWPNDVLLDGRKVAGVLAESSWDGQQLVAIVGVGVNVRTPAAALAPFGESATSIAFSTGREVSRGELLRSFVGRMDSWLQQPWPSLYATWEARLWGRGQPMRLLDLGQEQMVVVLGVDSDGALRVRLADGTERRTTTGELIL
jgi:BirA family biotin operon repressor/biotin-[acetyl-CoA-carboxylase] ligase